MGPACGESLSPMWRPVFYALAACAAGSAVGFLFAHTFAVVPAAAALIGLVVASVFGLLMVAGRAIQGRW